MILMIDAERRHDYGITDGSSPTLTAKIGTGGYMTMKPGRSDASRTPDRGGGTKETSPNASGLRAEGTV